MIVTPRWYDAEQRGPDGGGCAIVGKAGDDERAFDAGGQLGDYQALGPMRLLDEIVV